MPELHFNKKSSLVAWQELVCNADAVMNKKEQNWFKLLLFSIDIVNLERLYTNRGKFGNKAGWFTFDELKEKVSTPEVFFEYIQPYIVSVQKYDVKTASSIVNRIAEEYFSHSMCVANLFLKCWFEFENQVVNYCIALYNGVEKGKNNYRLENCNVFIDEMKQYGVESSKLSALFQHDDLYKSFVELPVYDFERKCDEIRWLFLESFENKHLFDVEAVFIYILKYQIVNRWVDNASCEQVAFEQFVNDLPY